MTRRALAAAVLVCMASTPAFANHRQAPTISAVTQFCGDRVCSVVAAPVREARRHPSDIGARYHAAPEPPMGDYVDFRLSISKREAVKASARGLETVSSAAGPITVAPSFAASIQGFIADVVARGFKGPVHCFSLSRSHVPGSLHFTGNACDFAQRGWGKTVALMYHVRDLALKWGLRDGCTFGDCGHIDSGTREARLAYNGHNLYGAVARFHELQ
jgi:hypothetical protein